MYINTRRDAHTFCSGVMSLRNDARSVKLAILLERKITKNAFNFFFSTRYHDVYTIHMVSILLFGILFFCQSCMSVAFYMWWLIKRSLDKEHGMYFFSDFFLW